MIQAITVLSNMRIKLDLPSSESFSITEHHLHIFGKHVFVLVKKQKHVRNMPENRWVTPRNELMTAVSLLSDFPKNFRNLVEIKNSKSR